MPPHRSLLFAPANHPRRVEKAFTLAADAVILDLEDAVPVSEKETARASAVNAFAEPRLAIAYVRVNAYSTPYCYGDLLAAADARIDGIVLPKTESGAELESVDWLLLQLERARGLPEGGIEVMPIIETARGVAALDAICTASKRVARLAFGAADYALDLGLRGTRDERDLDHARASVVLASRVHGLEPPIDTVFMHLGDLDGLRASAERARDFGFQGKLCIHPEQLSPVNAAFSPSDAEVAKARAVVRAFEAAEIAGSAAVQIDGHFVDYPVVEQARRTLALVDALAARTPAHTL